MMMYGGWSVVDSGSADGNLTFHVTHLHRHTAALAISIRLVSHLPARYALFRLNATSMCILHSGWLVVQRTVLHRSSGPERLLISAMSIAKSVQV